MSTKWLTTEFNSIHSFFSRQKLELFLFFFFSFFFKENIFKNQKSQFWKKKSKNPKQNNYVKKKKSIKGKSWKRNYALILSICLKTGRQLLVVFFYLPISAANYKPKLLKIKINKSREIDDNICHLVQIQLKISLFTQFLLFSQGIRVKLKRLEQRR